VELLSSSCKELHWQVFFRGELAAALRAAFSKCPLLMNEINLYRLPYIESPTELAAKVEEAVEAQIKSLDLSTPMKDRMNEIEEAVLETVPEEYLTPRASDPGWSADWHPASQSQRGRHHQSAYRAYHCLLSHL
jgi:hypothetical protein